MGDERVKVSESRHFRRRGVLERIGTAVGRALPEGRVRRGLRDAFRNLIGGRRGAISSTLPGGEVVHILPQYRFVTWNPAEYQAFRAAVRPGDVVLDVGANVGAYTLLFGQWVKPGGRVYAFEPAPDAFAGLVRHVELNGLTDVVTFVRAAAGERSGKVRIVSDGIAGTNRVAFAADDAGGEEVRAVSLDDFCGREGITPALVKIDVEGWELEVLRGARETLRRGGDRLALFVELHPAAFRELGMTREDVAAALDDLGLRVEPLGPCDDPLALEGECLRLLPK